MTNYTPLVLLCVFSLASLAALAEEAKQAASDCQPVPDELEARQKAIAETAQQIVKNMGRLHNLGPRCTARMADLEGPFFQQVPAKARGYDKRVTKRYNELKLGICKQGKYDNASLCEGAKQTTLSMLADKKKPVKDALEDIAGISSELAIYRNRIYFGKQHTGGFISVSYNPYAALISAFTPDSNFPDCPAEALSTLNAIFRSDRQDPQNKVGINKLWKQTSELEDYLRRRESLIDAEVAEISKERCDTAGSSEPIKIANRPEGSTITGGAEVVAVDAGKSGATGTLEASSGQAKLPVIEAQKDDAATVKVAPAKLAGNGSESAVMAALTTEKEQVTAPIFVPAAVATANELPAVEAVKVNPEFKPVGVAEEKAAISAEPVRFSVPVKSIVEVEPVDRTRDFWGIPNYRDYDTYKESIGAPNLVKDVNVNDYYAQWVAGHSLDTSQPDFGLRLQKAINATAGSEGYAMGPSTFQDGIVGSRTKSSIYRIENSVAYQALFQDNLRRQGLIP